MPNPHKARLSVHGVAADVLSGVDVAPAAEDVAARRVAVLTERIRTIVNPPPSNKYQASFMEFLRDCVWTIDEGRGGKVGRFPAHYPFVADLVDALHVCPYPLMIEKSRRVLASWTVCAWDVWLAAGGRDPRWVSSRGERVLMNNDGYRQIFVVGREYKSSCRVFLHQRIKPIVDFFERNGCRELWPTFPRFDWREDEGYATNGSRITACAQGADVLRGPGATHVHGEEFSFWEQAQRTLSGLIPCLSGGGHVTLITTALANSYARLVRDGNLKGGWRAVRDYAEDDEARCDEDDESRYN